MRHQTSFPSYDLWRFFRIVSFPARKGKYVLVLFIPSPGHDLTWMRCILRCSDIANKSDIFLDSEIKERSALPHCSLVNQVVESINTGDDHIFLKRWKWKDVSNERKGIVTKSIAACTLTKMRESAEMLLSSVKSFIKEVRAISRKRPIDVPRGTVMERLCP